MATGFKGVRYIIPCNDSKMQQMLAHDLVMPSRPSIAELVYTVRCLFRNEAKITQVMCRALHRSIEWTTNWYGIGVELQGHPPAFLNICDQAGFGVTVSVLVHQRRDSVTLYILRPGSLGKRRCTNNAFKALGF